MSDIREGQFLTTQWTLILGESQANGSDVSAVLTALCERYRAPVLTFFRRKVSEHDLAEDLYQGFFQHLIHTDTCFCVGEGGYTSKILCREAGEISG